MLKPAQTMNIEIEVIIGAPVAHVFNALTRDIGKWWGAPYLVDEDRYRTIKLEPKLGGRMTEVWSATEGSVWGLVTELAKNKRIEISGAIGMAGAVWCKLGYDLEVVGTGTRLKMIHQGQGEIDEDSAEGYKEGWQDLLGVRLKSFCEKKSSTKKKR